MGSKLYLCQFNGIFDINLVCNYYQNSFFVAKFPSAVRKIYKSSTTLRIAMNSGASLHLIYNQLIKVKSS